MESMPFSSPGDDSGRIRFAYAVLVAAALTWVGGCAGTRHPTVAELRAIPGATARYPGSEVYVDDEQEGQFGIDSGNPAHLRLYGCGTGAGNAGQVTSWYAHTLEAAGWVRYPGGAYSLDPRFNADGISWRRGEQDFSLRLAVRGGLDGLAVSLHHQPGCAVGYETLVQ
jgi:hypothetical protein